LCRQLVRDSHGRLSMDIDRCPARAWSNSAAILTQTLNRRFSILDFSCFSFLSWLNNSFRREWLIITPRRRRQRTNHGQSEDTSSSFQLRLHLKLLGTHHVAIISSNYAISKRFYIEILRLEIVSEVYREDRDSYKLVRAGSARRRFMALQDSRRSRVAALHVPFYVSHWSEGRLCRNGPTCDRGPYDRRIWGRLALGGVRSMRSAGDNPTSMPVISSDRIPRNTDWSAVFG
jgi:hypothetical protein